MIVGRMAPAAKSAQHRTTGISAPNPIEGQGDGSWQELARAHLIIIKNAIDGLKQKT
jgi:hypothetical protein